MFFVSFLCGEMLLSVHIYENVFLYRCTAHWATMVINLCYRNKMNNNTRSVTASCVARRTEMLASMKSSGGSRIFLLGGLTVQRGC